MPGDPLRAAAGDRPPRVQPARRQDPGRRLSPAAEAVAEEQGLPSVRRLGTSVMVYMIAMMLPIGYSLGGIALGPVRTVLLFMVVPLMVNLFAGKYGRIRLPDIMLLAYMLWQGVAIGYWHGAQAIQFVGSVGIEAMGGYLVARAGIRSARDYEAFAKLLSVCVLMTLPFAAIESITGNRIVVDLFDKLPLVNAYGHTTGEQRLGLYRAQVNFQHTIHYGIFCALAYSGTIVVLGHYMTPMGKYLRGAGVGLASFFSVSSGGFLPFVLQAMLLCWRWIAIQMKLPKRWLLLAVLFAIFYAVVEVLSDRSAFMVLLTMAAFSTHNAYWRTILFEYAMKNVAKSPLVGVGLNDWERPSWVRNASLDNFFAYVPLVYGVPALIFLAVAWLVPLFRIAAMKIPPGMDRLARCRAAWVITMFAMIMALCTVHVWGKIYSLVFFVFGTGMWMLDANDELRGKAKSGGSGPAEAEPDAEPAGQAAAPVPPQSRYTRFPGRAAGRDSRK